MAKHFKCDLLDSDSIDRLKDELNAYSKALSDAAERARMKLADEVKTETQYAYIAGRAGFDVRVDDYSVSDVPVYDLVTEHRTEEDTSYVHAIGEDALFLEFGAGQLSAAPGAGVNDAAVAIGATIGSYPSKTAMRNVTRGYWHLPRRDGGGWTVGTYATCGMYNAGKQAHENAVKVLSEEVKQI